MSGYHGHVVFLDPFGRLDSPIHRLPAGTKCCSALAIVLAVVSTPLRSLEALGFMIAVAALQLGILLVSRIPFTFLARRMLIVEPIILGVALLALFQPNGSRACFELMLKGTLCAATMLLLANTTPIADLLRVLRRVRIPALLVTTMALACRYLYVLVDQLQRMRRARASRSFGPSFVQVWRSHAAMLGQLFVRSYDRAERIYLAMCARGWEGAAESAAAAGGSAASAPTATKPAGPNATATA
jgi:cobalt/nickel transport system permease protein